MPNPQLTEYIRKAKAAGQKKEEITSALLGAGWQQSDVDEAFAPLEATPLTGFAAVGGKSKTLIVALSVLLGLILAGGGFAYYYFFLSESGAEPPQSAQQEQQPAPPKEETIQDILAKAKNIGPVEYERVGTSIVTKDGSSPELKIVYESKVWQELPNYRIDLKLTGLSEGTGEKPYSISIIHKTDGIYSYDTISNTVNKSSPTQTLDKTPNPDETLEREAEFIIDSIKGDPSLKVIGEETVKDKQTTVVGNNNGKIWIWNKNGIPLKFVDTSAEEKYHVTNVTENNNFVFGDIPDSIFDIPEVQSETAHQRDASRKSNAQAIATGLALYASEQLPESYPPETDSGCPAGWQVDTTAGTLGCPNLQAGSPVLSTFIRNLPSDTTANIYVYSNQGNNTTYCLGVRTENDWMGDPSSDDFTFLCNSSGCRDVPGIPSNPWTTANCPEG